MTLFHSPSVQSPSAWGTRATLGSRLFPVIAEETAEGLSAVNLNLFYDYGNSLRYKPAADGVTDDTSVLQKGLNVAGRLKSEFRFRVQTGQATTTYVVSSLTVAAGVTVSADDGVVIQTNSVTATNAIFSCITAGMNPTTGTGVALTVDGNIGNNSITVASVAGLTVGQLIRIRTNQFKSGGNGRNQELNVITAIDGVGKVLTLRHRLIHAYAVANTAEIVAAATPVQGCVFRNLHLLIPTGKDGGGFYFESCYEMKLFDCDVQGANGQPSYQCWRSAYVKALRCSARDGQNMATPGLGYGVNMAEASHNCRFIDYECYNVRENAVATNAKHCDFVNCVATNAFDNGFNSHGDGSEDCDFINCKSLYSKSKGFAVANTLAQDLRIRFIKCQSFYSGYVGFFLQGSAGVQHTDIQLIDYDVRDSGNNTATSYGIYAEQLTGLRVRKGRIADLNANNDRGSLYLNCTDVLIDDLDFNTCTSNFPIAHNGCTGLEVRNSRFKAFGANEFCHSQGVASTGVWIHNCTTDQDVIPTLNAGDRIENCRFPTIRLRASGVSSVANAAVITHGMGTTPDGVIAISQTAVRTVAVRNITSTQFEVDINVSNTGAADAVAQNIMWWAWKGPVQG